MSTTDSEPAGNGATASPSLQQLLLAGLGWMSEGVAAADELADDLARRVGVERDQMRTALHDALAATRREAERLGVRAEDVSERTLARLGLARREALDELDLRVAQLEHRLRLLEDDADRDPAGDPADAAPADDRTV